MKSTQTMPDECVKILGCQETSRRIVIVKRLDGHYVIRPERWYTNVYEGRIIAEGWIPTPYTSGIFETVALAERQAGVDFSLLLRDLEN